MQLTYTVLQKEGDLRFNLVRTRENSGALAQPKFQESLSGSNPMPSKTLSRFAGADLVEVWTTECSKPRI